MSSHFKSTARRPKSANAPQTAKISTAKRRRNWKNFTARKPPLQIVANPFGHPQPFKRSRARARARFRSPSLVSPALARQVVLRNLPQLRAARVAHRVVYEADVRAPARAPAVNPRQLFGAGAVGPERAEVETVVAQGAEALAQLAGAHASIVVNDGGRLARGAGEGPRRRPLEVRVVRAVVRRDRADVGHGLDEARGRVVRREHSLAVPFRERRDARVERGQDAGRNLFDPVAGLRLAADDVEVVAVQTEVLEHEVGEALDLCVVLRADDRVDVEAEASAVSLFERVERADAVERAAPVAGHAAHAVVRLAVAVERDVKIKGKLGVRAKRAFDDLEGAAFQKSIGGDDEAPDAVVLDEETDDLRGVVPKGRLAARKPEVCDRRHRRGDARDLLEGQVAGPVQLLVVEAGFALRVAARGDEEDERAESALASGRAQQSVELGGPVRHGALGLRSGGLKGLSH